MADPRTSPQALAEIGYVEEPVSGLWRHRHYLDGWPDVYPIGDRWCAGGRAYASALDALAMALEPDDPRQATIHAARGCCDG